MGPEAPCSLDGRTVDRPARPRSHGMQNMFHVGFPDSAACSYFATEATPGRFVGPVLFRTHALFHFAGAAGSGVPAGDGSRRLGPRRRQPKRKNRQRDKQRRNKRQRNERHRSHWRRRRQQSSATAVVQRAAAAAAAGAGSAGRPVLLQHRWVARLQQQKAERSTFLLTPPVPS